MRKRKPVLSEDLPPPDKKGRRGLRWVKNLLTLIFVVAALALTGLLLVPTVLGWQGVVVLSGSMEPEITVGGVAYVEPIPARDIGLGDVITFRHPSDRTVMATHRVVGVDGDRNQRIFETKGDANDEKDDWIVRPQDLVGRVRFDLPYVGYLASVVTRREIYIALIIIPAGLLILLESRKILREVRKGRRSQLTAPAPAGVPDLDVPNRSPYPNEFFAQVAALNAYLLATGEASPAREIAQRAGVSQATATRWIRRALDQSPSSVPADKGGSSR